MRADSRGRGGVVLAIVAVLVVAAVLLAGTVMPGGTTKARAATGDPVVLAVYANGVWDSNGTLTSGSLVKQYTLADLEALPAFAGYAGFMNSVGNLTPKTGPEAVTGVKVLDVLANAFPGSGLTAQESVDVHAPDNYGHQWSYDQMTTLTGFAMYDATTKQTATGLQGPLAAILVYSDPGLHVMPADSGPLRFMIADQQSENAMMTGSDSIKNVSILNVVGATLKEWQLKLVGLKNKHGVKPTRVFTRNNFEGCSAPGCHGAVFNGYGKQWTGTPLYLLMGEVDGGRDMTYNAALARKGYRIRLYSASGASVTISSKVTVRRSSVIVANGHDGAALHDLFYPLRLVGPPAYTPANTRLGRITKIVMLPMKP